MIGALTAGRAFAAGLALGLAVAGIGSAGLYVKGRVDGWANYEAAQNASTITALTERFDVFEADLAENRAEGDAARSDIAGAAREVRSIRNEISGLADRLDCLSDPRVGVRVDAAAQSAAAAIDRAAGQRIDGDAERGRSDRASPPGR